jgi:hypothetical protein
VDSPAEVQPQVTQVGTCDRLDSQADGTGSMPVTPLPRRYLILEDLYRPVEYSRMAGKSQRRSPGPMQVTARVVAAFQAGHAGSIPVTRSTLNPQVMWVALTRSTHLGEPLNLGPCPLRARSDILGTPSPSSRGRAARYRTERGYGSDAIRRMGV